MDPIYSNHPARNNRIKVLLKKRNPSKYYYLSIFYPADSHDPTLERKVINRISASVCREKIKQKLLMATKENTSLRQLASEILINQPWEKILETHAIPPFVKQSPTATNRHERNRVSADNHRKFTSWKIEFLENENKILSELLESAEIRKNNTNLAEPAATTDSSNHKPSLEIEVQSVFRDWAEQEYFSDQERAIFRNWEEPLVTEDNLTHHPTHLSANQINSETPRYQSGQYNPKLFKLSPRQKENIPNFQFTIEQSQPTNICK